MASKLILEVEDADGMDSGCIVDILQTLVNHHGKVVRAIYKLDDTHENDLMHMMDVVNPPEQGKC